MTSGDVRNSRRQEILHIKRHTTMKDLEESYHVTPPTSLVEGGQRKRVEPLQPSRGRLLRLQFAERERELRRHVRTEQLTPAERAIDAAHSRAVERGHFTYDDPETGLRVLTRLRHFLRGSCCGNACRHCVYGHEAVPAEVRARRRFNSAFWVDRPPPPGEQRLRSDDPDDVDFV